MPKNTPLTEHTGKRVLHLVVGLMLFQLIMVGYVFYQSYEGRVALVDSQQKGCARSILDRKANATGWRTAETARRSEGQNEVADRYKAIADGLEARSQIICDKAFPKVGLLP